VENPYGVTRGISKIEVDGAPLDPRLREILLADDNKTHSVHVALG